MRRTDNEMKRGARAIQCASAVVALLALVCFSTPNARGQCQLSSPDTWILGGNGN